MLSCVNNLLFVLFWCNLILAKIKLVLKITNSLETAADFRIPVRQAAAKKSSLLHPLNITGRRERNML